MGLPAPGEAWDETLGSGHLVRKGRTDERSSSRAVGCAVAAVADCRARPPTGPHAQLGQHRRDVVVHRADRDHQPLGDLDVAQTVGEQGEDLGWRRSARPRAPACSPAGHGAPAGRRARAVLCGRSVRRVPRRVRPGWRSPRAPRRHRRSPPVRGRVRRGRRGASRLPRRRPVRRADPRRTPRAAGEGLRGQPEPAQVAQDSPRTRSAPGRSVRASSTSAASAARAGSPSNQAASTTARQVGMR